MFLCRKTSNYNIYLVIVVIHIFHINCYRLEEEKETYEISKSVDANFENVNLMRYKRASPKPSTAQICYGYNNKKGRCLKLENCVLQPLKENYIKYKAYYCILNGGSEVGVCCPNDIAIPTVYNENSFYSERRRSTRHLVKSEKRRIRRNVADEEKTCGKNGRLLSQVSSSPQNVENKAWPWIVTIINTDTGEHHCGATLISRYHVLSAAHCLYYGGAFVLKDRIKARLGEYDFNNQNESSFNDYEIAHIFLHERYDEPTHENDIALLILARPARYTVYVQPACMPKPGEDYTNKTAVVVGWGLTEFAGPKSAVLREVQVPVWQYDHCSRNYLQTIFDTNLCAAGYDGGKDSCQGDSGGPLMTQRDDGRWEVIGVVSWGVQCGRKDKPGVYTQINKYYEWLYEKQI